jgi:hypothetical protein
MTEQEMRELCLSFPEVTEGTSYGRPSFLVNKKFLTRLRQEIPFDEREMLMEAEPSTFHITPHYRDYPTVLARLESIDPGSLRNFLERRWRKVAPKKLVKAWDETR